MHGEQIQRIGEAGRAGVGESRSLHAGEPSPAPVLCFGRIRRWPFLKVKLVDFAALIDFRTCHGAADDAPSLPTKKLPLAEAQTMKLGFFTMPIHPVEKDWRQSLR